MKSPAHPESDSSGPGDAPRRDLFLPLAIGVGVLAFLVRLLHVFQIRPAPFFEVLLGDAAGYDQWAQGIAAGEWLGSEVFYQAPLYPYFLGVIYSLGDRDLMLVRVIQALLGAASCVLLAGAGRRFFSPGAGIAAGALLAFYAPAIFFDSILQKSVLDVFLLCLVLRLMGELVERPRPGIGWALGLASGALCLSRENALLFLPVIGFWLLVYFRASRTQCVALAGLFVVGVGLVLGAVGVRNQIVGGEFHLTTSQMGPNFYIGNNRNSAGSYKPLRSYRSDWRYERIDATELAEEALGRSLTPAEVSSFWMDQAFTFMRTEPGRWLKLLHRKVLLFVGAMEVLDTEDQYVYAEWSTPLRLTGSVLHFGVIAPLAVVGLWITWSRRERLWVLYAMAGIYAAGVIAFYVVARYRYPVVPFVMLFAGAALAGAREFFRTHSRLQIASCLVLATCVALVSRLEFADRDFMRSIMYFNIASGLTEQERRLEAIDYYRKVVHLNPTFTAARLNLGILLAERGEIEAARPHLEEAVRLDPKLADGISELGDLYEAEGDLALAEQFHRDALERDPENARVHLKLGLLLLRRNHFFEAEQHLLAAARLEPQSPEFRNAMGALHSRRGEYDAARDAAMEALRLEPEYAPAHYNLGLVARAQGELAEAIAHFEKALAFDANYVQARNALQQTRAELHAKP